MEEVGMINNNIHFHAFKTKNELRESLSKNISQQLQSSIDKNGKASLLVSGGSTPKPLFEMLRESDIEWEKVSIGLCDERWVPSLHADSNEKLVKEHLLQDNASKATFIGMYQEGLSTQEAQASCSEKMREKLYPFDVVILGMGGDGHTASLFPKNSKLQQAYDKDNNTLCIAIEPDHAPHMRMSLTRAAILSAKHLYLHFEGAAKLDVYEKALHCEDIYEAPIASILHQNIKDLEVYYS